MAYHHTSRPRPRGGFSSAVLFIFFVIAGGSFLAVMLDREQPASTRVYLAEDISPTLRPARLSTRTGIEKASVQEVPDA